MDPVTRLVKTYAGRARRARARVFRDSFSITANTKILDLGSGSGANIHAVLQGTAYACGNVYIADIDRSLVDRGARNYGFVPVVIPEQGPLPFEDQFFDIVYCSSVIEHVTVPKAEVWSTVSGRAFREASRSRQREFANEIRRLGRQYFVQTPYRHFPIESHSWLPFAAWLPRRVLLAVLRATNVFWVKRTAPDWYLLNRAQLSALFKDADIVSEKSLGLTKSIMAIRQAA